jgi:putative mRNA 3-end processing factor
MPAPLVEFTDNGFFCPKGNFYIDPWRPVSKAVITHAHADHARPGHGAYLCEPNNIQLLRHRLSPDIKTQALPYGKMLRVNDVRITLFPAGHIIGSSQVLIEDKYERWVISGDYSLSKDKLIAEFEPVKCDHFVTECTFGLPVFQWKPAEEVFDEMRSWWRKNVEEGHVSVIAAYSLGKAQRIIQNIGQDIGPIYTHAAVENINEILRAEGIPIAKTTRIEGQGMEELRKGLIVCPPAAMGSRWIKKLGNYSEAFASGWMALRGARRRRGIEKGFILSDHADWHGLNKAVVLSGASSVYSTHGYTDIFSKWLQHKGLNAAVVKTDYHGESGEQNNEEI